MQIKAAEALQHLVSGNRRFVADQHALGDHVSAVRRNALRESQQPFAVILGCSDSRVPAEIVFDQGLGDLFVVRVAGNIVEPTLIGSVEFAAAQFGSRLVVVLGHSSCGAVKATVAGTRYSRDEPSPNLVAIAERIQPSVDRVKEDHACLSGEDLIAAVVQENVRASVRQLSQGSRILKQLISDDGLMIVGAEYSLDSGEVEFLDLPPSLVSGV